MVVCKTTLVSSYWYWDKTKVSGVKKIKSLLKAKVTDQIEEDQSSFFSSLFAKFEEGKNMLILAFKRKQSFHFGSPTVQALKVSLSLHFKFAISGTFESSVLAFNCMHHNLFNHQSSRVAFPSLACIQTIKRIKHGYIYTWTNISIGSCLVWSSPIQTVWPAEIQWKNTETRTNR